MIKIAELKIDKLLKDKKSKFVLPIHDEVMILLANGEEYLIPQIKAIMEDTYDVMPWLPMVSDVEIATKNWADKQDYKIN